jgi:NAD(P)-dependent dehydrogenase (short-subunit alcohol dehydrogenase family)
MHLARCAAVELGAERIRINAVMPGPVETPMMAPVLASEGYLESIERTTPLGRIGQPEDIADGILSVLHSDWLTGQTIAYDGGASLMTVRGHERAARMAAASK